VQGYPTLLATKVSGFPLSEEILECEFLKKFSTLTFDYNSETSNPVQHTRHFRDKMPGVLDKVAQLAVYSRNDPLLCITFPSNLKDEASDWFYSLPLCSLRNFEEITKAFLTQ